MRAIYFDCFAGVSGDMTIGALIDLGVDIETLRSQLASLALSSYEINVSRVKRSSIAATKFDVLVNDSHQPHRHLRDIREIIERSSLSELTRRRSMRVFELIAEAEARVHGTTADKVHFHEVGAVDSIIDVVGAMICFELLCIERFISSPLRVGRGTIKAAHGEMPVPAPGTAELLRGVPVYSGDREGEFVTPTGAAIITALCEEFGPLPDVKIERIGYGAGTRDPKDFPNALRLILCDIQEDRLQNSHLALAPESVMVIETNIDDMSPQAFGYVMERAFEMGALDVFMVPAQMKKDRPGVLLTVLCNADKLDSLIDLLLRETMTLGVRYYETRRRVLDRIIETVETPYGDVRIKVARAGEETLHFQPEYDDCARLAREANVSLIEVQRAAEAAYRELKESGKQKLR